MASNINRLVQPECGGPNPLVAAAQQITSRPRNPIGAASLRHINPALGQQQQPAPPPHQQQLNFTKEFAAQYHGKGLISQKMLQNQHQPFGSVDKQVVRPSTSQSAAAAALLSSQQHYEPALNYMLRDRLSLVGQQQQQQQQHLTAGEQLETKYRSDMISSTRATNLAHETAEDQVKRGAQSQGRRVDDVEFWQSLSQKYVGPSTYDNISKLRGAQLDRSASAADEAVAETEAVVADSARGETGATSESLAADETVQLGQADYDPSKWFEPTSMGPIIESEYVFDERNPLRDEFEDPFNEGLRRLEQGDIPSAALLFEAAVQRAPENSLAWQYLGTTQAQNEKDISAIRALRRCLDLDPSDQKARLAIAVSLANELQRHESYRHLLEWLTRNDKYKGLNASVAHFEALSSSAAASVNDDYIGDYADDKDEARYEYVRAKFVEAARIAPRSPDPEVQSSLGVLFNMRGEYDKAVDCFKAALSVSSNDSLLWNRLGATLANGNKSDEAIAAYRKALELAPGYLRTRYNLAISLIHLNLYDEAAKQLVQILNMQAAGKGSKNVQIRTRSITSTSIWNTLRTVATLLNKPQLYPIIDGRDLDKCNEQILRPAPPGN